MKTDRYFLESAGTTSFFFEPRAFDSEGRLRQAKELSINKVCGEGGGSEGGEGRRGPAGVGKESPKCAAASPRFGW